MVRPPSQSSFVRERPDRGTFDESTEAWQKLWRRRYWQSCVNRFGEL